MRHIPLSRRLAIVVVAIAVSVLAAESNPIESCFLAIPFGNGNIASIQLTNGDTKNQTATIERYSQGGKLLDTVTRVVQAGESTEVRIDLPSPEPELGWIRVLSNAKALKVSAAVDTIEGATLETVPQQAVPRHPLLTKGHLTASLHRWTFDVANNLGFLMYFVNLSTYPVQVAMCQDDVPGCTSPTLPYSVSPMASISFPIDQSRRYAVIESTPGYSAATGVRVAEGGKRTFKVSSCIRLEGSTACTSVPMPKAETTPKFVSPVGQQLKTNVEASLSSPAASAAGARSPAELAELIKTGKASRCVIATEPPGAEIYVDGLKAGVAPLVFVLLKKGDTPRTVEIRMDGYRTVEKHLVPDGQLISIPVTLEK
ncbi:MAG: PEGA domain-containing protein [Candidatus Korobacteraceae bacterium]|jgi:hypothetical protein